MAGGFGVLALQGDFAAHAAALRDARRGRRARCAARPSSTASRAS